MAYAQMTPTARDIADLNGLLALESHERAERAGLAGDMAERQAICDDILREADCPDLRPTCKAITRMIARRHYTPPGRVLP